MAQVNTTVGDFDGNVTKILKAVDSARAQGADIVTFPELAVCGYPPEDLLFKPQFIKANLQSLKKIIEAIAILVQTLRIQAEGKFKGSVYCAAPPTIIYDI